MTLCRICSKEIMDNSYRKVIKCGHIFHNKCVYMWYTNNHTCPVCLAECNYIDYNMSELLDRRLNL